MKFKFKKYIAIIALFTAIPTFTANTTGYAWSESLGWFDFGNVTVTDTTVTGYAYNDNTGWLVLDGVTNSNGTLSGYAWSESLGYFNFSNASISAGAITGYAYNDNTGWLSFSTGTNVTTTWAPAVAVQHTAGGASYGGGSSSYIPLSLKTPTTSPSVNTPTTTPNITIIGNNLRDLKQASRGNDVKLLQQFLNSQGFTISNKGLGSPGLESTFFGNQTKQALIRFQIKNNISPAAGYFGPITKAFIKSLLNTNQ